MIFCTLFNENYLTRGLALYQSLLRNCPEFELYIFAMDDTTYHFFKASNLSQIVIIKYDLFESPSLLEAKAERTKGEYCWTCTPFSIKYVLENFDVPHCTYLDADLYFFSNPTIILTQKPKNKTVMITEHRYSPEYDQSETSGRYCVQFMYFEKEEKAMSALNKWGEQCLEWCYNRMEDGKFGDQKYLDTWEEDYPFVYSIENIGAGLAPWNTSKYEFEFDQAKNTLQITDNSSGQKNDLVFFHFHSLRYLTRKIIFRHNLEYKIPTVVYDKVYNVYCEELLELGKKIKRTLISKNPEGLDQSDRWANYKQVVKQVLKLN